MQKFRKISVYVLLFLLVVFSVRADEDHGDNFNILADEIYHMQEGNAIVAQGNVEITYRDHVFRSNRIIYLVDEERIISDGVMTATHVSGMEYQLTDAMLSRDMQNVLAKNLRALFPVGASFKAEAVKRNDGGPIRMKNASYTACKTCIKEDGKESSPIWRASANNITFNEEEEIISYKSIFLSIYDVPVFYSPYFYHPSPSVKRKTGFLSPSLESSRDIGQSLVLPYYIAFSDYNDLTLATRINTKHDPIFSGDYRHRFSFGDLDLNGMITNDDDKGSRHHVNTRGSFNIDDNWRFRGRYEHVSDDTVLKYYDLADKDRAWLTSEAKLQHFSRNGLLDLQALYFQDLREDVDDARIPDVIPYVSYSNTLTNLAYGSYFSFTGNLLEIERDGEDYNDTRRLATLSKLGKRYNTNTGAVFEFSGSLLANVYSIDNYEYIAGEEFSGTKTLFMPSFMTEVSYPFARKDKNSYQVVEPILQLILAPDSSISDKIPNEDSKDFEFENTSIFRENRFTGFDRYEVGSRVNYGINWSAYGRKHGKIAAFLGQSYSLTDSREYPEKSGFDRSFSDYVGRVFVNPADNFYMNYRFRFDQHNFSARHSELDLQVGPQAFNVGLNYLFLTQTAEKFSEFDDREELTLFANSRLTDTFRTSLYARRDLAEDRNISLGASFVYEDECLVSGLYMEKNYTYDRDYSDGFSFKYKIEFKGLSGGGLDSAYRDK